VNAAAAWHSVPVADALDRFARDLAAGTVLFEEGQPGTRMYIVVTGEVEIRRRVGGVDRLIAVLGPGEFFGEMAILNGRPRSARAVVGSAARLLTIDGTTFEAMLRARPEIALRLIRSLASRLDSANHHVELLLLPAANHRVVQCLRRLAEEQLARDAGRGVPVAVTDDPGEGAATATAVLVSSRIDEIAARVGLGVDEVAQVIDRLRATQLVMTARDAGIEGDGFVVPEVGRLQEFLEFAALRSS
jgi:CRP/FNR family transcriptional regulator, cyclic AMP receptor protein